MATVINPMFSFFVVINLLAIFFAYLSVKNYRVLSALLQRQSVTINHEGFWMFGFINKIFYQCTLPVSEQSQEQQQISKLQKKIVKNAAYSGLLLIVSRAMVIMAVV